MQKKLYETVTIKLPRALAEDLARPSMLDTAVGHVPSVLQATVDVFALMNLQLIVSKELDRVMDTEDALGPEYAVYSTILNFVRPSTTTR